MDPSSFSLEVGEEEPEEISPGVEVQEDGEEGGREGEVWR